MTFELAGSASCKLASADFQLQLLSFEPDDWVFLTIPTHWPTKETIPLGQGVPEMPKEVYYFKIVLMGVKWFARSAYDSEVLGLIPGTSDNF